MKKFFVILVLIVCCCISCKKETTNLNSFDITIIDNWRFVPIDTSSGVMYNTTCVGFNISYHGNLKVDSIGAYKKTSYKQDFKNILHKPYPDNEVTIGICGPDSTFNWITITPVIYTNGNYIKGETKTYYR